MYSILFTRECDTKRYGHVTIKAITKKKKKNHEIQLGKVDVQ